MELRLPPDFRCLDCGDRLDLEIYSYDSGIEYVDIHCSNRGCKYQEVLQDY